MGLKRQSVGLRSNESANVIGCVSGIGIATEAAEVNFDRRQTHHACHENMKHFVGQNHWFDKNWFDKIILCVANKSSPNFPKPEVPLSSHSGICEIYNQFWSRTML